MIMAKKKPMDKLSQEVAQALACGMSYGKWKAKQSPVKLIPVSEDIPAGWSRCEWCGTLYKPKSKRPQKYCQAYCQVSATRARVKEKANGT
jgi:hypothetical protein